MKAYISGYTKKDSKGIYVVDVENNRICEPKLVAELSNPTYMQIDYTNKILYCNNSTSNGSNISSFKILNNGNLKHICDSFTENANSCYLSLDTFSNRIHSAIYHGGIFESRQYSLEAGMIKSPDVIIKNTGSGPNKNRQEASHLHITYPYKNYVYCCDLGADLIRVFDTNTLSFIYDIEVKPGSGPRHIIISNNFAYIITELSNEIIIAKIFENYKLKIIEYVSLLPKNYTEESIASAIRISNNGKYLYTANRGYDHINVFRINDDNSITNIQNIYSGGHWCRDFNISPCSKYLLATHEKSYNVSLFTLNNDGILTLLDNSIKIPEATCIHFYNE